MFTKGKLYSRKDIYSILNVPNSKQNGNWCTGYTQYNGEHYIFVNENTVGRTGHDHENHWDNNLLVWTGKNGSHKEQKSIKKMIDCTSKVNIFSRDDNSNIYFTYLGRAVAEIVEDTRPVTIHWKIFDDVLILFGDEKYVKAYKEGREIAININSYERNSLARRECIKYYGCQCTICGMDFEKIYGDIGRNFIHVHHLKQLSKINHEYIVNPIEDLRPVCPNCHAMIHQRETPFTIKEMKQILDSLKK